MMNLEVHSVIHNVRNDGYLVVNLLMNGVKKPVSWAELNARASDGGEHSHHYFNVIQELNKGNG